MYGSANVWGDGITPLPVGQLEVCLAARKPILNACANADFEVQGATIDITGRVFFCEDDLHLPAVIVFMILNGLAVFCSKYSGYFHAQVGN